MCVCVTGTPNASNRGGYPETLGFIRVQVDQGKPPRWQWLEACVERPHPLDTPLRAADDTTLSPLTLFRLIIRLFGATTFLEMSYGKGEGAQHPSALSRSHKSHRD